MKLNVVDKEILRLLYSARRPLTGNQIAKHIGMTASGIKLRLEKLQSQDLVKQVKQGKMRTFKRAFGRKKKEVKAPSKIYWTINVQ